MSGLKDLSNVWQSIKEVDLKPIREEGLQEVNLAVCGRSSQAKETLMDQMRHDPNKSSIKTFSPILSIDLEKEDFSKSLLSADSAILLVDQMAADVSLEQRFARSWVDSGRKIIIFIYPPVVDENPDDFSIHSDWAEWGKSRVLNGSLEDKKFLQRQFVPAVLEAIPGKQLALGRKFPLFRTQICRQLISESCFTNAAYAFSTGLAEVVPVVNLPLNVADMMVLSKNQAFLVYRLGLTLGLSTRWQDYVTEFGGVLGSGFLWRQVARQLVGLIPAWGIIPKVAVSYAGTYVVGNVVLQWYLTGKQLSRRQISAMYKEAFQRGKGMAGKLAQRLPKSQKSLKNKGEILLPENGVKLCPNCQRTNASDAGFCQYCGKPFDE